MRFFFALLKMSIRASITLRGAFLIESSLMIISNLTFLFLWWLLFKEFKQIGHWTMHDMMILYVVGMLAYGSMQVCFGGFKQLSKMIINGDLDPFMTQPKNLLIHIGSSKSLSKGWGSILTGAIILILSRSPLCKFPLILLCAFSTFLIFTAMNIIAHSIAFWLGSIETVSKKYCDSLYLFVLYPTNIYSGLLQIIMFTLIPAGIMGYIPVELIRTFSISLFITLLIGSSALFLLSFAIFYLGLKKYESGNQFGTRL